MRIGKGIIKIFLLLFIHASIAHAAYYDTLPKGVRNFTYRIVQTSEISGSYNGSGDFKGYNLNANINADAIKGLNSTVDVFLGTLTPTEYANFSFGTFEGSASSKVTAQGFGGGYGFTREITGYAFIPFYKAVVDLRLKRTAKGRNSSGTLLELDNLPDVDARLIQSLIVNYYGYKPLGKWNATNFGDTEFGFLYQIKKWNTGGLLTKVGGVAPTGKIDDPDTLQDIPFGDGQWDAFGELGGGINLPLNFSVDAWTRLTYQFPNQTNIRLPDSATFPVTTRKGSTEIKLGNKAEFNIKGNYSFSDQWMTSLLYTFEYKEADKYKSPYAVSNSILSIDSEKNSHTVKASMNYSTVALYQSKKFFMPLNLNLSAQSILGGKNVPYYNRFDFEIAFYF